MVHKGTEGLGDRLQQLLMVLRYARATGRALVLDWRDPKFARDGGFNFEDFFRLRKVPVFNSNEFLFIWRRLQHYLQVRPAMFRHHLDVITEAHWNFLKFPENNTRMNAIANGDAEDYSEEVVVFAGDQHRYYHYEEIVNLRLRRWMADKVRRYMLREGLKKEDYVVVHLRGGDKPWKCEEAATWFYKPNTERFQTAANKWPTLDGYIEYMKKELERTKLTLRVVVVTDTPCLKERWNELCTGGSCASGSIPTRPKQRQRRLIENSVLDFALMSMAARVVGDGHSLFATMAEKCRATGKMNLLGLHDEDGPFKGWDPDEWEEL